MNGNVQVTMRYRVAGVLALMGFAILMSLRIELSSVAARTVVAAIAFSLGGLAWICLDRSRAARRPSGPS